MEQKYIVGDVVIYHNKVMVVKEPRDGSHFDLSCPKEGLGYCFVGVDEIKPVSLTPEILEKNGWNKEPSENVMWYKYRTDKSNLYICKDTFNNKDWLVCVALDKHYIANINYVHQLQHLLFGLGLSMDLKV